MLYMIFHYGLEPVLFQRILIGFEAISNPLLIVIQKSFFINLNKNFIPIARNIQDERINMILRFKIW